MKYPEATLENYDAVYEHYTEYKPDPRVQRLVVALFSKVFDPYSHTADDVHDAVAERLDAGHRLIMTCTHHKLSDEFLPGEELWHDPRLERVVGNAFVPAKQGYYKRGASQRLFDALGARVVFRGADGGDDQLVEAAKEAFMATSVDSIVVDGKHMFVFPFGTRDKTPDGRGIVRRRDTSVKDIAYRSALEAPVSLWPMAIYWGERKYATIPFMGKQVRIPDFSRRPDFAAGMPIDGPFASPDHAMDFIQDATVSALETCKQGRAERLGQLAIAA